MTLHSVYETWIWSEAVLYVKIFVPRKNINDEYCDIWISRTKFPHMYSRTSDFSAVLKLTSPRPRTLLSAKLSMKKMWGFCCFRNISTGWFLLSPITLLDPVIQSPPSTQKEHAPKIQEASRIRYQDIVKTVHSNLYLPIAQRGCLSIFATSSKTDRIRHNLKRAVKKLFSYSLKTWVFG